ncbi:non-ribosomal peptide synthetase, partial [Xanthomonas albilineans]|uniref:non-ribosomal peptide synthetase n=1 Tax=Xanthomonas albilineans TaxID=29447 RepID=UPI001E5D7D3A
MVPKVDGQNAFASVNDDAWFPLSANQRNLWFLYKLQPELQGNYNISFFARLLGEVDLDLLDQAIAELMRRHAMLRTRFREAGEEPEQRSERFARAQLQVVDVYGVNSSALDRMVKEDSVRPFDLTVAPLFRVGIYRVNAQESVIVLTFNHLVVDGWSLWRLIEELGVILEGIGGAAPLRPVVSCGSESKPSYFDYVCWQRDWINGDGGSKQFSYWKELLADEVPSLNLPVRTPRAAFPAKHRDAIYFGLDMELSMKLNNFSDRCNSSIYVVLLAAYFILLRRITGQDDFNVGSPMPARRGKKWSDVTGAFFNQVVLQANFDPDLTVGELLRRVRSRVRRAMENQDFPFFELVERLNPHREESRSPFFQTMFVFQNPRGFGDALNILVGDDEIAPVHWGGLHLVHFCHPPIAGAAALDLVLEAVKWGEKIGFILDFDPLLFERSTLEQWMGHWRHLLEAMVAEGAEDQVVDRLPLLSEAELHQVLTQWNATAEDYPRDACVHELFERQVARDPSAIAVVQGEVSLTYGELNARANRLAHYLRELGVCPDDRVAICVQRSVEMVLALLAVLKAGGAYVPLDPAYPPERLAYMLADCGAVAVLTQTASRSLIEESAASAVIVDLHVDAERWAQLPDSNPDRNAIGLATRHLAYVIYTSGSTGTPKGVMIEHRGCVNLYHHYALGYLRQGEKVLVVSSFSFDLTLKNIFSPLFVGSTVVLAPAVVMVGSSILSLLESSGAALINCAPSQLYGVFDECGSGNKEILLDQLRYIVLGGEPIKGDRLSAWISGNEKYVFVNSYGPAEITDVAVDGVIKDLFASETMPIGRPIANTRIYILDAHDAPVPVGVVGELYIGGDGVGRGYLNRDDLTAERFLTDPFSADPAARMYRTGDLGRWRADGTIEFVGRNDHQVKIRGFRIELGEIEARLSAHADVRECVVVALEDATGTGKWLVAYWVGAEEVTSEHLGAETLRSWLSDVLPDYMVPAAYVRLDRLPLTPNGKLDRKALPAPDGSAYAAHAYEAPQGNIEQTIATIWSDLLGLENIGRHDNFFALGGHSLLTVRVASCLRQQLDIEIGVADLFAHATLQQLAARVASSSSAVLPPIVPLEPDASRVLSFAQQRLWFLSQFEGVSQAYHISGGLRLRGALDTQALQRALDRIVARHASLRTTFGLVDGQALQQIAAEDSGFQLIVHDLRELVEREGALERLLADEAKAPFALERGPLIRGRLVQLADDESVLFVTMHHIVSDGWSLGILIDELSVLYRAFARGEADPLTPLPIQYADYASWQRQWLTGEVLDQQASYWRETLSGAPVLLELPTDRPRPARQDHAGATLEVVVGPQQAQALKALSQRHGLTLYMTLIASWALLLSRLSGQEDVVIGSPVANRGRSETEGLIGFFVNTLALRVELSGSPTLAQLLASVKARALQAQAHQDIPFEQVVELLQPPRSLAHAPLFQVMLAWQNTPHGELDLGEIETSEVGVAQTSAQFDLSLSLAESEEGIVGSLTYATALFEHSTLERWMGHWRHLLAAMLAEGAEDQAVDRLPLLDEVERYQVLTQWNATAEDYPRDACIHELFERQVARDPSAIAVVQGEVSLTYGELNARANRLAHYLRELGVCPDDRVAICVQRSVEMVVALLAVLKAGGAYVPLDPAYPPERLAYMQSDCGAVAVLTDAASRYLVEDSAATAVIVDLQADGELWEHLPDSNPDRHANGLTARHLAYVIYTSGSTGAPKGAMNEHRGLVNMACAQKKILFLNSNSRILQFASFSFDACTFEIMMAICWGGALFIPFNNEIMVGDDFFEIIKKKEITNATLPPTVLPTVSNVEELVSLQTVVVAGEALPAAMVKRWGEGRRLINAYGPTETTVCVSVHECDANATGAPPIGRPIANVRIYILDAHGAPVSIGVVGELYIGGDGVGRGYLNRDDLTTERFLIDPFSTDQTARMYRSGDLGRWRADGTIEFVGRNDHQVKIRGFRIELGEIEARLSAHADVRECVVVALDAAAGSDRRLVAYWVGAEDVDAQRLRSWLSDVLPDYMVPAAYVQLDKLPLTANGKLDRKALPAPDGAAYAAHAYEAPQGEIEQAIAVIWRDLLGLETIGRHDNFFALGGHSLLVVRVASRLRQDLGAEIGVAELFAHATLQQLAACVASSSGAILSPIMPLAPDAPRVLSFAQQRLWFLSQFEGVSQAYHISGGLRLRGPLERHALERALDRIVARHASLRTTFALIDGQALQQVAAEDSGFHLIAHDLREVPEHEVVLERLLAEEAQTPFALDRGPLIRGVLVQLAHDEHVLFVTMHHIVSDGWSIGILTNELSALYRAFARGEADPLPPLPIQYADYASWQRQWLVGEVLQQQATYWRETLSGAPVLLELPTDRPRPARQDHAGAALEVVVGPQQAQALKELSQRHGLTMYMTLLASCAMLLSRLSGQDDVVIGSPVANRGRSETEGLIGFFVNTLALRVELSGSPTLTQLLASVKERALQAQTHQDIPFEQVVELVQPPRSLAHAPLFQVMFAWQNTPQGVLNLGELDASGLGAAQTSVQFDLSLSLEESKDGIVGSLTYATALFEHATLERWIGHWQHLLAAMVAEDADDRAVDRLPILGEAERHQVLIQWNATAADYPRDACVHELFEAQVARDPTAIAVVQGETSLTYGELNARANRLAHYLRESGVRPDERVAICVQRSVEMVVALLAVLKAGGAYVPLDPAYPPERLAYMRADCGALTVLTDTASRHLVEGSGNSTVIVDLQVDGTRWEHLPDSNPDRHANGLTARHLAYVIYTSGSTGAPKGVMIEHRNLCNYALDAVTLFGVTQSDLVLQQNSISFDLSVEEIFPALLGGAALVLAPTIFGAVDHGCGEISSSPRVTVVHLTMAHWHSLVGTWKQSPELARVQLQGVRLLNVTGDAISPQKLREWHALRPHNIEVVNTYGPTETTVSCTAEHLTQDAECDSAVTIGQPLANTRIYILDINSAPVPIGVVGELYIGGDGVGRGYLNRDDLTAERFLTDPFSDNPTARMYRTGDLGRWRADGTIEFVGRNDHQVKIRGFRIELGEIEARLSAHADVRECVVVALEDATGTGKRLVAYWVGAEGVTSEHLSAETLRSWLTDVLPDYMVPAAYVRLDRLPLTPNGKLDRKALPTPDGSAYAAHAYEAPQGEIEQTIAAIWSELLGLENIGRHDNFFALGGHSLLGVRLISRIRSALGLELPLATLFAQPRLVELAQALDCANSSTLPAIVPADRNAALPLSYAQQRLWFLAQFDSRAAQAYTLAGGVDLHGALNLPALQQALDRIVARHEALRTCFVTDDDGATQSIAPADVGFALTCADLRNTPDAQVAAQDQAEQETNTPFDLSRGPLIRGRLLQLAEQQHRLLVTMHHIVSDGWSMALLVQELSALYAAFVQGQPDPLPPLPIQYPDYAVWQRRWLEGPLLQRQLGFWREHLHDAPALLELPTDHPRPVLQDYRGDHVDITLDAELTDALRALSQRHGTTVFMTVLAGWAVLLSRLSGQDQVVIGAPVANRTRSELEALIGFFVNAQALRIDLRGAPTVADLLAQVRVTALAAQDHQDVPFEQVIEALNPERSLSAQPVFQVVLTWQNVPEAELVLPDIRLQPLSAQAGDAKFDLEFSLHEQQDRIVGSLGYATALFDRSTIERHLAQFVTLLRGMVADVHARVAQLPLLPADERVQLQRFTVTESTSLPPATCIHSLFEAQVQRTPDAIAVSEGEHTLRYAELDGCANRLAQRLRRSGVGVESRVALYLPRSIEQVVAVLATLKAGAAYVPLDPELPSERLAFLLEDSRPRAVLTCTDLQDHLPASRAMLRVSVLTLDDIADRQHDDPGAPNVPGLCPDNLAYVIYTSGSTGQPKGTLLTHAGAAHYLQWAVATYRPTPSAVVSSSLSFDATLTSLLAPLLCGAQVELLPDHDTLDALRQRLCDPTPLGLVKLTPAHLEVLGQQLADHPTPLNSAVMVIGGEALPPATLARWQALAP